MDHLDDRHPTLYFSQKYLSPNASTLEGEQNPKKEYMHHQINFSKTDYHIYGTLQYQLQKVQYTNYNTVISISFIFLMDHPDSTVENGLL